MSSLYREVDRGGEGRAKSSNGRWSDNRMRRGNEGMLLLRYRYVLVCAGRATSKSEKAQREKEKREEKERREERERLEKIMEDEKRQKVRTLRLISKNFENNTYLYSRMQTFTVYNTSYTRAHIRLLFLRSS